MGIDDVAVPDDEALQSEKELERLDTAVKSGVKAATGMAESVDELKDGFGSYRQTRNSYRRQVLEKPMKRAEREWEDNRELEAEVFRVLVAKKAIVPDFPAEVHFFHSQALDGSFSAEIPGFGMIDEDEVVFRVNGVKGVEALVEFGLGIMGDKNLRDAVRRGKKIVDHYVWFDFIVDKNERGIDNPLARFYRRRLGDIYRGRPSSWLSFEPVDEEVFNFDFHPNPVEQGKRLSGDTDEDDTEPRRPLPGLGYSSIDRTHGYRCVFTSKDCKNIWIVGKREWLEKKGWKDKLSDAARKVGLVKPKTEGVESRP